MGLIYHLPFVEGEGHQTKESVRGHVLDIDYVFKEAKYKKSRSPRWVNVGGSAYALDFDGYSTFMKDEPLEIEGSFTIFVQIAARCFEACHGNVSTTIIDQLDRAECRGMALGLFRHGEVLVEVGDGEQIVKFQTESSIRLYQQTFLAAVYNETDRTIRLYIDGETAGLKSCGRPVRTSAVPLSIGRNNTPFQISDTFTGGMFAGLMRELQIFDEALSMKEVEKEYRRTVNEERLTPDDVDLDERLLLDDVHRPHYHAIPPQHWMNEPHAPFYYKGTYHLFYQKNAAGPYFSNLHWGHWTSEDMVYWKNEPTALFPKKEVSPSGVWSGSAAIGPDGVPLLFYTFADFNEKFNQGVAVARPKDVTDTSLVQWEMDEERAIVQTEKQGIASEFRDPFVWKDDREELWYLIIGGGIEHKGPTTWIYTSADCESWKFKGEFYTADTKEHPYLGSNVELPVLLPLHDREGNKKYLYLFMSYFREASPYQADTYYFLGDFDKENHRFIPDTKEPQLLDYGRFKFSGPSGFVDPVHQRSIVFSILQGDRTEEEEYSAGWAHNAGLPVEVFMENGELRVKPLEELSILREKILIEETNQPVGTLNEKLAFVNHKQLEIIVEFEPVDSPVGLEIKKDENRQEYTTLWYDREKAWVSLDRTKSRLGAVGDVQGGPLHLNEGLRVHLYIDHSTIECYLNNKRMLTSRAYPVGRDSDYLSLIGGDDLRVKSMKVYQLKSIWNDEENGGLCT